MIPEGLIQCDHAHTHTKRDRGISITSQDITLIFTSWRLDLIMVSRRKLVSQAGGGGDLAGISDWAW